MTTFSDAPWSGDASRWPDAKSFCASCLIVRPHDGELSKDDCSLPYKEPSGAVNKNALSAALAALNGARGGLTGVSSDLKAAARKKLRSLYLQSKLAQTEKDLPPSLRTP